MDIEVLAIYIAIKHQERIDNNNDFPMRKIIVDEDKELVLEEVSAGINVLVEMLKLLVIMIGFICCWGFLTVKLNFVLKHLLHHFGHCGPIT
jgi:hypothetical protein